MLRVSILRAPVDLLYNGGIGTYVKASRESNADVGDKATDSVRIDGRDLRCRAVGEGGNVGFYDFATKYLEDAAELDVPAKIDDTVSTTKRPRP